MSKPQSIKVDPWTDFPRLPFTFITDDFVHQKLAVFKVNAKGGKSTANLKVSVSQDNKGGRSVSDQVKLWFDLPEGRSLYSKIKSSNYLKVQFDNGVTENLGRKWNLYAGLNATKTLENISLRLGAAHLSGPCQSDNRLKVDFNGDNKNITWYNRTVVTKDKFTFGILGAYGLTNHVLVKNNILFGYKHDDNTSAYLRLLNNGFRKTGFNWGDLSGYFDTVKLDVISSVQDWKYGLQATLNTRGSIFNEAVAVVEHYFAQQKLNVKGSFSTNSSASLTFRYPSVIFNELGKTSVGVQGTDLLTDKRSFKYGVQVQFNV